MTTTFTVRTGLPGDVGPASEVLATAFLDYPWTRWTVDEDEHEERLRRLYALTLDRLVVPYGRWWVVEGSDGELLGAAAWMTPTPDVPARVVEELLTESRRLQGRRAAAAAEAEACLSATAPEEPHWYLGAVGVIPGARQGGLGRALVRAGLRTADESGAPTYLETSSRRNVAMYERLGFVVRDHLQPAGPEGPPCWRMVRQGVDADGAGYDH